MVLLEKRAHLVLKTPFDVVRLLPIDVMHQRNHVRRADGKQTVSTLPREFLNTLLFHPYGRASLNLRYDFGGRPRRRQPHRKMNVVGNSAHSKTLAIQFARSSGEICMKIWNNVIVDQRSPMFCAEDDMHQIEAQRLRHLTDYMSGLQPSAVLPDTYLGLRPRLVCRRAFSPRSLSVQPTESLPKTQQTSSQNGSHPGTRQPTSPVCVPGLQPSPVRANTHPGLRPKKPGTPILQAPKARPHTSLGRRPRCAGIENQRGLKARHIAGPKSRWQVRLWPGHNHHRSKGFSS